MEGPLNTLERDLQEQDQWHEIRIKSSFILEISVKQEDFCNTFVSFLRVSSLIIKNKYLRRKWQLMKGTENKAM